MLADPLHPAAIIVRADSRPALPRFVKLRHGAQSGRSVLLAPERVFDTDETALAVLRLCDGNRTVADIAQRLASEYDASERQILAEVIAMLQDLADQGVMNA